MLRCYIFDESYTLQWDSVQLDEGLTFVEDLFSILARDVRWLCSRDILVVKVNGDTVLLRRPPGILRVRCGPSIPTDLSL